MLQPKNKKRGWEGGREQERGTDFYSARGRAFWEKSNSTSTKKKSEVICINLSCIENLKQTYLAKRIPIKFLATVTTSFLYE